MVIIFILIMIGTVLYKKALLSDDSSKQISGIIANFCNPALLISSVFESTERIPTRELLNGAFLVFITYAILIACSLLLPILFHVKKEETYIYRLVTIFANTGFIGIPLISAVLGPGALIYVSINNLGFNILMYTFGIASIKKAKEREISANYSGTADNYSTKKEKKNTAASLLHIIKNFINIGTISSVLTIVLYVSDLNIPALFSNTISYVGRSTTFLSMLVLGVSLAQLNIASFLQRKKLFFFTLFRLIIIPVGSIFILRAFTKDSLLLYTQILMLALPAGNMPLILSKQHGLESETISVGILLSTVLSLITIPIVTLFVQ